MARSHWILRAPMLPAAECSILTGKAPKGIVLACNSGIRRPAATGQAISLSLSVADDVVASMSPKEWQRPRGGTSLWRSLPIV